MRTRPRSLLLLAGIAAALATGPILHTTALAGDSVVVLPGDTLSGIAARHDTTVERLASLNAITNPNRIFAGQRLRLVPAGAGTAVAAPAPAPAPRVHVVAAGEHLTGIAKRYGTTVAAVAAANRIANASRIFVGQRLTIPGAPAAAPAAGSGLPASMAAKMASRDAMRRVIVEEAQRWGVPPAFALAVAWQESGWRQDVVSSAGAVGVMQLLPTTAAWVGASMLGAPVDINDARANVRAGVRLLAHYLDRYDGNRDLVLAAYYQGQRAADRHGVYPVTKPYIASIRAIERMLGG